MKFEHLLYINRMSIPFVRVMKQHPNVIQTITTDLAESIKCELLLCRTIKSSYKHRTALKTISVEIKKEQLKDLIRAEHVPREYIEDRMNGIVEKAAICKAFTLEEVIDFVSGHPSYVKFDQDIVSFKKGLRRE